MANIRRFKLNYIEDGLYKVKLRIFTGQGESLYKNGIVDKDIIIKIEHKNSKYATEYLTGYQIPIGYLYVGGECNYYVHNENYTKVIEKVNNGTIIEEKNIYDVFENPEIKYRTGNRFTNYYDFILFVENIDLWYWHTALSFLNGRNTLFMDSSTCNLLKLSSKELERVLNEYKATNSNLDVLKEFFENIKEIARENKSNFIIRQAQEQYNLDKEKKAIILEREMNFKKYYYKDSDNKKQKNPFKRFFNKHNKTLNNDK